MAFSFSEEAYQALSSYMNKLEAGYANNPDGREIMADIESRIVELILEQQEAQTVVDRQLVDKIISQLGFPETVEGESFDSAAETGQKFPRRLYRNMEGAKLSGVCNGIATYFNLDPVWVRVGFFMPLLLCVLCGVFPFGSWLSGFFATLFGVFFMLYLILWICIPKARTPRQKLEMRGEKVTADSIRTSFAEEAATINSSPKSQKSASVWADIAYGLGRFIQFFVKALLLIIAICCALGMLGVLVGIIVVLFGGATLSVPMAAALAGISGVLVGITPTGFAILALATVLLFLTIIGYLLFGLVFDRRTDRKGIFILSVIFLILFVWLTITTVRNIKNWDKIEPYIEQISDSDDFDYDNWIEYDADRIDELNLDDQIEQEVKEALNKGEKVDIRVKGKRVEIATPEEKITIVGEGGRKSVSVSVEKKNKASVEATEGTADCLAETSAKAPETTSKTKK